MPEPTAAPEDPRDELAEALDRELSRLPEKYRVPIVLCDLEGRDHREAAGRLGWPVGTVSSRLSRGRAMLARRLSRAGSTLTVGTLGVLFAQESASAGMPAGLIGPTARAASLSAAGGAVAAGMVPAEVAALTGEVTKLMLLSKIKVVGMVLVTSALVAGGGRLAYRAQGAQPAIQDGPSDTKAAVGTKGAPAPEAPKAQEVPKSASAVPALAPSDEVLSAPSADIPMPTQLAEPAKEPEPHQADPLVEMIVTGDHTPDQLERARVMLESMITMEKEARGKSPQEIDRMIQAKAGALEKARWDVRMMDAQLRRLRAIRQGGHAPVADVPPPSAVRTAN
ncbi:RNA polymerase sigma factor [Aquisphaera giovannonii]|uniref:RNA polymerase sigma factor n=1 Tax=Aquisphaera giovannonii TaxID=406548 RepID=UPI001AEF3C48|nr:sigma factor-like helix-turn-helix DNA-binding protein [Aquisphaera giovannonii]